MPHHTLLYQCLYHFVNSRSFFKASGIPTIPCNIYTHILPQLYNLRSLGHLKILPVKWGGFWNFQKWEVTQNGGLSLKWGGVLTPLPTMTMLHDFVKYSCLNFCRNWGNQICWLSMLHDHMTLVSLAFGEECPPGLSSKMWTCCPKLVTLAPPNVVMSWNLPCKAYISVQCCFAPLLAFWFYVSWLIVTVALKIFVHSVTLLYKWQVTQIIGLKGYPLCINIFWTSATGRTRRRLGNTSTCPYYAFWHIIKSSSAAGRTRATSNATSSTSCSWWWLCYIC